MALLCEEFLSKLKKNGKVAKWLHSAILIKNLRYLLALNFDPSGSNILCHNQKISALAILAGFFIKVRALLCDG